MSQSFPTNPPPLKDAAPFIVIGSGIAGLYCALELSKTGRVILLTKASLASSNTYYAQGGIAAAIGIGDSPELHYHDTIMAGAGLCNSDAVLALVYEGLNRVKHLIDIGVPFDQKQGELSLTREAAHNRRRILHADGDATGRAISQTLIEQVKRQANITIYEEHFAVALATREVASQGTRHCCGVVTLNQQRLNLFLSSATILCSGGAGQIFDKTTNPAVATGDGMILAYRAGAVLKDLEFIQFHPTALFLPPAPPFLISESVRGEGALLLNRSGERFMPRYHKSAELAPRDIVARSIFTEIQNRGDSCVYLDLSSIGADVVQTRFPNIYQTCLQYGLDITKEPIPVAPAAHYFMGGIKTDLRGRTSVPGLYVAGEAAATGVHGANRLASNSLLEGLVFSGRIADDLSLQPADVADQVSDLTIQIHYPECGPDEEEPNNNLTDLHQITGRYLGIVRDAPGLQKAKTLLKGVFPLKAGPELNPAYFELRSMTQLASLIARAALLREESRGGHYRSDFPNPDPRWQKHICFSREQKEVFFE